MKISKILYVIVTGFFAISLNQKVFAWNEETHKNLSQYAAENSILELSQSNYMSKLGYENGINEKFLWNNKMQEIFKWIRDGAFFEDAGSKWDAIIGKARFNNHFHNPLKPWDSAGLSDLQSGESSLLWAQDSMKQSVSIGGDWSWRIIRDFFYKSLTSKTDAERQAYFAQTFSGLGHQMHLIQDAAQPAHVRNDAHPIDGAGWEEGLETWAKSKPGIVNSFASTPTLPQVALNINYDGYAPITQFIDTKQYIESFIPDTSLAWGLSEYTNSNFISDDTIFTENFGDDEHSFPYPRYSAQCYELFEENNKIAYLRKKSDGECGGEFIEHFAVAGPLFKYLDSIWDFQRLTLKLDTKVYSDYAQKLIPRAVGYSAGLLNYFFRGDMFMMSDFDLGYGYVIVNNTDEDVSGTFELWYDNINDGRVKITSWNFSLGNKSSGNNKSPNISFLKPTGAKEECKYIFVFRGQMGLEQDAACEIDTTREKMASRLG